MGLLSYDEWRYSAQESSAATRSKTASANDLGPDVADVFGHSTPPPWQVEKLLKKLGKKKTKTKDPTEPLEEGRGKSPNYSFDRFIQKAKQSSDKIDKDIDDANNENDRLDKEIDKKRKSKPKQDRFARPSPEEEPDDAEQDDEPKNPYLAAKNKKHNVEKPDPASRKPIENPKPPKQKFTEEQQWEALLDTSYDFQR